MKIILLLYYIEYILCIWKDNFTYFNINQYWDKDFNGITGKIQLLKNNEIYNNNQLDELNLNNNEIGGIRTNVTYCPTTSCYRAELKNPNTLRNILIPSNSGIYWFGISIRIPSNWKWKTNTDQRITAYIFQIHGGDNKGQSPIFGIRNEGAVYTINVCGNTAFSSSDSFCKYYQAGPVVPGVWENWVIQNKFSYDDTSINTRGFVRVWRNGKKYVDVSNLLTSYNDATPHYIKFGSYVIQWRNPPTSVAAIDWVGSDYRAISVGNSTSSYADVYTGIEPIDDPTVQPTSAPTAFKVPKSTDDDSKSGFKDEYIWIIIGAGGGILLLIILTSIYCCCNNNGKNNGSNNNNNSIEFTPVGTSPPSQSMVLASAPPLKAITNDVEMVSNNKENNKKYDMIATNEPNIEQI